MKRTEAGLEMSIRRRNSLIAIEYGTISVRLLQLVGQHVVAIELPCEIFATDPVNGASDPGGLAEDLRRALDGCGFQGRRCAVCLPSTAFLVDTVAMPEVDEADRAEACACEAVDRFGVESEEITAGSLRLAPAPALAATAGAAAPASAPPPASSAPSGPEQLLVAVRRRTAMLALDPLLSAGLAPTRLEAAPLAALRTAWASHAGTIEGALAFVHIEPTTATMLMARDGELLFHRAIVGEFGSPRIAAATALGESDAAPIELRTIGADRRAFRWSGLADEILQCLRYVERRGAGQWPSTIITSGPCAGQVELLATLESICGVPSQSISATGVVDPLPATLSPSVWAAALGALAVDLERRSQVDARRAA